MRIEARVLFRSPFFEVMVAWKAPSVPQAKHRASRRWAFSMTGTPPSVTWRTASRSMGGERALAAYMEQHEATLALLERITDAVAGHDVPGADPEHVDRGHVGSLAHWRQGLQGIADQMFGEGEYADD
jgi:hypothetical protein